MRKQTVFLTAAIFICTHGIATAEDAQQILETAQQKQLERWKGVDVYVVNQTSMGNAVDTWFERTEYTDKAGKTHTTFLPVSTQRIAGGQCLGGQQMTPEQWEAAASAMEMTGDATATEIESGLEQAGLPRGLLAASGSDPTATFDPRVMMGANADFARAIAEAQRQEAAYDPESEGQKAAAQIAQFIETAKLVGTESVEGRNAYHLRMSGLNQVQEVDGGEFRTESLSMWMDAEHYVPLRMKIDGTMTSNNETRPVTIENLQTDYRSVPGSNMYESYKRTMNISGMMDAAQQAEMLEAQAQMVEFEKEMANMPPSQREMMERMMGPQLEMMRNMASGGGFQMVTTVNSIRINPERTATDGSACPKSGAATVSSVSQPAVAANPAPASTDNLTLMVQKDLTKLGYDTGGTTGQMNTATIVAISKFQAENNMEVTGEVTPQLAGILSARASGTAEAPAPDPAQLQAAQQACLQQKMAEAQAAQKKKRGFGRLLGSVSRVAGRTGNYDLMRKTGDIYTAGATADDLAQAAKDLGLTEDDIAACQNPM